MTFNFSFRLRKKYLADIMAGKKPVEYRKDSRFWQIRIANLFAALDMEWEWEALLNNELFEAQLLKDDEVIAVCISGKTVHRRVITKIARILTPQVFSDQGKKDVDTKTCFAFYLGEEIQ